MKDSQRKATEACEAKVDSLTKVNRDGLSAEDLIKLEEKLKKAMEIKNKIKKERNWEVENRVADKKQVVNWKILKTVRIMMAYTNLIDARGKVELEKSVGENSKLLDMLAETNRALG